MEHRKKLGAEGMRENRSRRLTEFSSKWRYRKRPDKVELACVLSTFDFESTSSARMILFMPGGSISLHRWQHSVGSSAHLVILPG
jgi:hypothetical protein